MRYSSFLILTIVLLYNQGLLKGIDERGESSSNTESAAVLAAQVLVF
jgi:hypothetical protein